MFQRSPPFTLFILVFLTGILYWAGLYGPFVLDDPQTLELAKVPNLHWDTLWQALFLNETGPLYRPVAIVSFILTDFFMGSSPFAYKAVNLCLHLLTGVLLFFVSLQVVNTLGRYSLTLSKQVALLTTGLWMMHPLLVSTVLYSVQRMSILSTFFMLLAFHLYLLIRLDKAPHRFKENLLTLGVIISWVFSILSKENGILFPFLVLAFEMCIPKNSKDKSFKMLASWALISCILMAASIWYYTHHFPAFEESFKSKGFGLSRYALLQSKALVFYVKSIFWPTLPSLSVYHDDFEKVFNCSLWFSLGLLGALLGSAFVLLWRFPLISLGIFWFFIGHALESSILPLEPVSEYRNYFPAIGLLLSLVTLFAEIMQHGFCQRWIPRFMLLLLAVFGIFTGIRIESWSNEETFLLTEKLHHPLSARAHIEWAQYVFERGDYKEALRSLETAYALNPANSGPKLDQYLATCLIKEAKPDLYQKTFKSLTEDTITPYTILVLKALVDSQQSGKCLSPLQESESFIDTALVNPSLSFKPKYRAVLYQLKAEVLIQQKALPHAIIALDKAFHLNPKQLEPLVEKVQLLIRMHDLQGALITLNYLKIQPGSRLPAINKRMERLEAELQ